MHKLEITINVIIHATEDISKIFESFREVLGVDENDFSVSKVQGHFENPITIISLKIIKKSAIQFMDKFLQLLTNDQKNNIIQEIEGRVVDSTLHIRLGKQEFVQGNIDFNEKDPIKIKIQTPIYNKKDTFRVFSEIFQKVN
jgi:RNA binding exosome subunit